MQRRAAHLTDYRDAAYAARYCELVERVRAAERNSGLGEALTTTVARAYHKLLASKDEWEVARLFAAPEFQESLSREFEGPYQLHFHLGAWPFARVDPASGKMKKGEVGPWAMKAFRVMARLKFLRGSWLDPFRNSERAQARAAPGRRVRSRRRGSYPAPHPHVPSDRGSCCRRL